MTPTEVNEIKSILANKPKVVITTHRSPDGDAIGSSLALFHFLKKMEQEVEVVAPNDYPTFLKWMPGNDQVVQYETQTADAKALVAGADLIFCLDLNALHRMDELGEAVGESKATRVMIDHHPDPEDIAKYVLSDTSASSTAELVYQFIEELDGLALMNKDIAECLYAGLVTDTGSFKFPSTTARTHFVVGKLMENGLQPSVIHQRIFDTNSADRLRLLGYSLSEKMKVFPQLNAAYIALSAAELAKFNFQKGDTEGLVNYGLSIDGIRFSTLILEYNGLVKMSFRSVGPFDVNAFARSHFGGGGHVNAAGGASRESYSSTIEKFEALLPQYQDQLTQ